MWNWLVSWNIKWKKVNKFGSQLTGWQYEDPITSIFGSYGAFLSNTTQVWLLKMTEYKTGHDSEIIAGN